MANSPATPEPTAPVAHDPVTQTLALLQPWIDYVPQQQRRLGLFICLALAIHATTFFFLRIDTSRAELRHQPRTHVSVDFPQAFAVDGQAPDQFWDRMTDPRAFILPMNPLADVGSEAPPVALNSAVGSGALPEPAPPETYRAARPVTAPLEQQVEATMIPPRQAFAYDETPPAIATKTTWHWDDVLAPRHPDGVLDLPSPISDTDLSPTKLRIAVNPDGTVEHVLLEQSSGDLGATIAKDLDQQAVLAAQKIRFRPTDQAGMQWGRITIFWRYSAKPREEVVPTPPTTGP